MEFVLLLVVSLDLFFVCLSYGLRGITILPTSILTLSAISTAYLAISAAVGLALQQIIAPRVFTYIGFAVLLFLGCAGLLEKTIQNLSKRKIHLRLAKVHLVFEIYWDKTKADQDNSKVLTPYEAVFLALPLSLDCLVSGLSLSFQYPLWVMLPYMFAVSAVLCCLGLFFARHLPFGENPNSSIISGLILIGLAFWRLHIS